MNNNIVVVKIGGSTLGQHDTTLKDLVELQKREIHVVVVHGGGKIITQWLGRLSSSTQFVQGERVTDKVGLDVATAVLAGLVNKDLVASLNTLGAKAIGLSGVDGGLFIAKVKNPDLGYVGSIEKVNIELVSTLLKAGYLPVISSISFNPEINFGCGPLLLNVNADIAAGELAAALLASKLVFLTDVDGILDKSNHVIATLTILEAEKLIESGVVTSGMIPKVRSSIRAIKRTGSARIIDGRRAHTLLREIEKGEGGTTICKN